jgi:hypothetical protein
VKHRSTFGPWVLGLTLLLASCASRGPTIQGQTWIGTTTAGAAAHPLAIATTLDPAGAWTGTYTVERTPSFTGELDAELSNGELVGVLIVSDACRFALEGNVTGDALTATFSPTACPGGVGGTWSATLETSTPGATTIVPHPDAATFDDGALFGAAVFHGRSAPHPSVR